MKDSGAVLRVRIPHSITLTCVRGVEGRNTDKEGRPLVVSHIDEVGVLVAATEDSSDRRDGTGAGGNLVVDSEFVADPEESLLIEQQAAELERLMPIVSRQLFSTDPTHPIADLPLGQFRLCTLLHKEGRRTMSQIGEDLGISVSAVTQMADRLERAGLVERTSDTTGDRRNRYLRLTPHGRTLMQSRTTQRLERTTEALKQLNTEERTVLLQMLDKLRVVTRGLFPVPPDDPEPTPSYNGTSS
jgi:DNA-binding MarR family transcriptional regulator